MRLKASRGSEQYESTGFVSRMIIRSLTALRSQAVQYGRLGLFEIG